MKERRGRQETSPAGDTTILVLAYDGLARAPERISVISCWTEKVCDLVAWTPGVQMEEKEEVREDRQEACRCSLFMAVPLRKGGKSV